MAGTGPMLVIDHTTSIVNELVKNIFQRVCCGDLTDDEAAGIPTDVAFPFTIYRRQNEGTRCVLATKIVARDAILIGVPATAVSTVLWSSGVFGTWRNRLIQSSLVGHNDAVFVGDFDPADFLAYFSVSCAPSATPVGDAKPPQAVNWSFWTPHDVLSTPSLFAQLRQQASLKLSPIEECILAEFLALPSDRLRSLGVPNILLELWRSGEKIELEGLDLFLRGRLGDRLHTDLP